MVENIQVKPKRSGAGVRKFFRYLLLIVILVLAGLFSGNIILFLEKALRPVN